EEAEVGDRCGEAHRAKAQHLGSAAGGAGRFRAEGPMALDGPLCAGQDLDAHAPRMWTLTGRTLGASSEIPVSRQRHAAAGSGSVARVEIRGRSTRKVAPPPGVVRTSTVPWWAATTAATMERPSPAPPRSRLLPGSAR